MSEEYSDPAAESEMRRRAAWFLGMLVLVAVLVVALMVLFLKGGKSGNQAGPTGPSIATAPVGPPTSASPGASTSSPGTSTATTSTTATSTGVHEPPRSHRHRVTCSSAAPCVAQGDIGNAVAAINSYRQQHGQPAVDGRVSPAAQQCALSNGSDCNGAWAESQVAAADGQAALQKVLPFAQSLLDPGLKSLQVGWAYDPGAHQYYFAVIQDT